MTKWITRKIDCYVCFEHPIWVWIFIVAFAVIHATCSILQHHAVKSTVYDLGLFSQLMWNTVHGDLLLSSIKGFNYLGDHFQPVLLLIAPIFAIYPKGETLLIIQSVVLAMGALPISWIAYERFGSRKFATAFALVYLCYPVLHFGGMFDFHPIAFAPTVLAFALWYLYKRKYLALLAMLTLALTIKEEMALTVAMFGVYLIIFHKKRLMGASIVLISMTFFILVLKVIMPYFLLPYESTGGYLYMVRYSYLGSDLGDILLNLIIHPIDSWMAASTIWRLIHLTLVFLPLAMLSFIGWRTLLIIMPLLGYSYLSSLPHQFDIRYQYLLPAVPFLVVSAIEGLARLRRGSGSGHETDSKRLKIANLAVFILLFFAMLGVILHLEWPLRPHPFNDLPVKEALEKVKLLIPANASLGTTNQIGAHFADRAELRLELPFRYHEYHYKMLGLPTRFDTDYQLLYTHDAWSVRGLDQYIKFLDTNPQYEKLFESDELFLFRKKRN